MSTMYRVQLLKPAVRRWYYLLGNIVELSMAIDVAHTINELRALSIDDRLKVVEAVWDSLLEEAAVQRQRIWHILSGRKPACWANRNAARNVDLDAASSRQTVSLCDAQAAEGMRTMTLRLYDRVALNIAVPAADLRAGDVATLVDITEHPSGGPRGFVLEVFNALGESIAVVTVPETAVEPLRADEVLAVRPLAIAV